MEFYQVGTEFYLVLPSFTGFFLRFRTFFVVYQAVTEFYWVLPRFAGFYLVLPSFTGFEPNFTQWMTGFFNQVFT